MKDHYGVLGLKPPLEHGYTDTEIRRAYRKRALALHPDRCTDVDAPAQFAKLLESYEFLINSVARQEYDQTYLYAVQRQREVDDLDARRQALAKALLQREQELKDRKRKPAVQPCKPEVKKVRKRKEPTVIDLDFADDEALFAALEEREAQSNETADDPVVIIGATPATAPDPPVVVVVGKTPKSILEVEDSSDDEDELLKELEAIMKKKIINEPSS